MQIETVQFVPVTIFGFPGNVFEDLAECSCFSWGDNNRTLILPERIAEALSRFRDRADDVARLEAFAEAHPGVYVDLEN